MHAIVQWLLCVSNGRHDTGRSADLRSVGKTMTGTVRNEPAWRGFFCVGRKDCTPLVLLLGFVLSFTHDYLCPALHNCQRSLAKNMAVRRWVCVKVQRCFCAVAVFHAEQKKTLLRSNAFVCLV